MKKILMLARANLRKGKGQTASFLILIVIGTMLLNLAVVTGLNFWENFDKKCVELNAEHTLLAVQKKDYSEELYNVMKSYEGVTATEKRDILLANSSYPYGDGELTISTILLNKADYINLGKISMVEKADKTYENTVYLPYLFKTGGGYAVGDAFTMKFGSISYSYTVGGFFENMSLGSTNMGVIGIVMEEDEYLELENKLGESGKGKLLLAQLKNKEEGDRLGTVLSTYLNDHTEKTPFYVGNSYSLGKIARTFTASIGTMLVSAFSIIILVISLIVIKFRIDNSIEEDMQNIGSLKAIGYTSKQIIRSIILQFFLVAGLGVILGILVSYAALPLLSNSYASQSGILWEQGFDLSGTAITLVIILGVVALTALVSARKIKKLHPIVALRFGITTHNFHKNHLPLDKIGANLNLLLSIKATLQNKKQNIMIALIIAAMSFASVFALVMYYNISVDNQVFLKTVAGEIANVSVTLDEENYDNALIDKLREMPEVEKAIYFDYDTATSNKETVALYITEDYAKTENVMCYKGRNPRHGNEAAIGGGIAKAFQKKVGDTITLSYGMEEKEYLITGLIQSGNGLGFDAELTDEAFRRINEGYRPQSIYVYLKDGMEEAAFLKKIEATYKNQISETMDIKKMIDSQLGIYTKIVSVIVIIIVCITTLVVVLIIYLVVKTQIIRKRRDLGIQKALGFTTKQLMIQLSLNFLPVVAVGTIIGACAGYFGTNPMLGILFRGIGIMKMEFVILPAMMAAISIGVCIIAFLVSMLVAVRIRKISAQSMMQE